MPDREDYDREDVVACTLGIHGIRSWGRTGIGKLFSRLKRDDCFPFKKHRLKEYQYNKISAFSTFFPGVKKLSEHAAGYWLTRQTTNYRKETKYPNLESINVICHSFGTYMLTEYLKNAPEDEVHLDTVILLGSVVEKDYPWTRVIHEEDKVDRVINVIGSYDLIPSIAPLARLGTSGTLFDWHFGRTGFTDLAFKDNKPYVDNQVWSGGHLAYNSREWVDRLEKLLYSECKHTSHV